MKAALRLEHLVPPHEIAFDPDHRSFPDYLLPPERAGEADVALYGVPYAGGTFRLVGTNLGPVGIRQGLRYFRTYSTELDIDIDEYLKVVDFGNLDVVYNDAAETYQRVSNTVTQILHAGLTPIMLGGDHSISEHALKTFAREKGGTTGVIWIDNHLDSMSDYQGDRNYCGCPLYNLVHEVADFIPPENIVHIGSRGFHNSSLMWKNVRDMGVKIIKADDVQIRGIQSVMDEAIERATRGTQNLYLTFDIDVGEGTFVPGTQCPRPGGLYPWQMLYAVRRVGQAGAGGFDLMEVAPTVDVSDSTIMLAASLVLEFLAGTAWRKANSNGSQQS
jgi:agmatinase